MLHFQINPHSGVPVYRQMIDQLKYYIASQTLKPGDQLPSIRELAHALSINPTTVVRVYTDLERESVIEMRHGKGAFVASAAPHMSASQREESLRGLARQLAVEAMQIGAPPSQVLKLVRQELEQLEAAEASEMPSNVAALPRR